MEEEKTIKYYLLGDKLNLEQMVREYSRYVYTIVQNMSKGILKDEDIEETISDVFFAVWKNRDNLIYENPLKPYIAQITKNLTKNKLRKLKVVPMIEEIKEQDVYDMGTEYVVENKEKFEIILNELKKIGKDSEIFTMFYYEGKKAKDIATKLGITEANVNTKLHRIRKKIRKNLIKKGVNDYGKEI